MKNPKWREAYPQGHKVKFGGKFLTTWSGYSLSLEQTNGGTISAQRNRGYEDDEVPMSYTANQDCYFNGWSANEGSFVGNNYKFGTNDATAKASFINTYPSRAYSNTTTGFTALQNAQPGMVAYAETANPSKYNGYAFGDSFFVSGLYDTIKNKNYFVLKYDMAREILYSGNYRLINSYNSQGSTYYEWTNPPEYLENCLIPGFIEGTGIEVPNHNNKDIYNIRDIFVQHCPLYSGWSGENLGNDWNYKYAAALSQNGKKHCYGKIGTITGSYSAQNAGILNFSFNITANGSGVWNKDGWCIEDDKWEDNSWRTFKYVFDMNDYSMSAYKNDQLVYFRNTSNITTNSGTKTKMAVIYNNFAFAPMHSVSQMEGTHDYYIGQGMNKFKNISMTYFDTCEQANMWAQHN